MRMLWSFEHQRIVRLYVQYSILRFSAIRILFGLRWKKKRDRSVITRFIDHTNKLRKSCCCHRTTFHYPLHHAWQFDLVQQLDDMLLQRYHLVPGDFLRHQHCRKHTIDWSSQSADSPLKNLTFLSWSSVWILLFHWLLEVEVAVSNESEPMRLCNWSSAIW